MRQVDAISRSPAERRTLWLATKVSDMPQQPTRSSRIEARIRPDALAVVRRAAEIQGRSLSDFVAAAAQEVAHRTIEETEIIRLAVEDQRLLVEALLNPPEPTPAMERAIERYQRMVKASE